MNEQQRDLPLPIAPFPGIRPYSYNDREIFFAREKEAQKIVRQIVMFRGVLFFAESGVGKSSVINAKVIPLALQEGFAPERVRVQPTRDSEFIIERIDSSAQKENFFLPSIFAENDNQQRVVVSIDDFVAKIKERAAEARPLLIFDQFEEWITLFEDSGNKQLQESILDAIVELINDIHLPVKLLFVFREDYFAKMEPLLDRCPDLADHYIRLTKLRSENVQHIISAPFQKFRDHFPFQFSKELVQITADQFRARSDDVNLTEIQIVCTYLFDNKIVYPDPNRPDWQPSVQQILESYLEEILDSLEESRREPALALLGKLVTTSGTRNVISEEDLIRRVQMEEGYDPALLLATLNDLIKARLLFREQRRDVYFYEIVSEFLVDWIDAKTRESQARKNEKKLLLARKEAEQHRKEASKMRRLAAALLVMVFIAFAAMVFAFDQKDKTKKAEEQALAKNDSLQNALSNNKSLTDSLTLAIDMIAENEKSLFAQKDSIAALYQIAGKETRIAQQEREKALLKSSQLELQNLQSTKQNIELNQYIIDLSDHIVRTASDELALYAYNVKARALSKLGRHEDAIVTLNVALKQDSSNTMALDARSYELFIQGDLAASLKDCIRLVRIDSMDYGTYLTGSLEAAILNQFDHAKLLYEKALEQFHFSGGEYFQSDISPLIKKETHLNSLFISDTDLYTAMHYYGVLLDMMTECTGFESLLAAADTCHKSLDAYYYALNWIWLFEKMASEISDGPAHEDVYGVRAMEGLLWHRVGRADLADSCYREFLADHSENKKDKYEDLSHFILAASDEKEISMSPPFMSAEGHSRIVNSKILAFEAQNYDAFGDSVSALAAINKALLLQPDNPDLLLQRAKLYATSFDSLDKAQEDFRRLAEKYRKPYVCNIWLADIAHSNYRRYREVLGDLSLVFFINALEYLDSAMDYNPGDVSIA